ncbi:ABC transporter ATP-binding protein [Brevibacterium renqingii]|uniref:ABC transporter ATP-binding protein n=1 Tax=Brevibacterium renqingii TaxID=2776916 RepID=UPI001FE411DC|nr:ABC transporter ATP-binding protein [Brevibacterium renqingii]
MTVTVEEETPPMPAEADVIVRARELNLSFGHHHVLKDIDLDIPRGRVVGLVGESGSGKSTLAKALVGMNRISSGSLTVAGTDLARASRRARHALYRRIQYIPQDPYSSLDPRRTIAQTLAEAFAPKSGSPRTYAEAIAAVLESVQLPASAAERYPHEFSGGQRQRIAIARALAVGPELFVADEITSALDVSVQAEIIRLLARLREGDAEHSMVFITHNLAVAQAVCDDIVVMRAGRIVETGELDRVFAAPQAEYTRTLLDSVPGGKGFTFS